MATGKASGAVAAAGGNKDRAFVVDLLKQHAYDAYLTGLFLDDHLRGAFYAIHAFGIELGLSQTNAHGNSLSALVRLGFWNDALNEIFDGGSGNAPSSSLSAAFSTAGTATQTPVSKALAFAARHHGLERHWLQRAIDTREADVRREERCWSTLDEAETFAEGVYSSLNYAAAELLVRGKEGGLGVEECAHTDTALSHLGAAHGLMQMLLAVPAEIPNGGYLGLPRGLFQQPLDPATNCAVKGDVLAVVQDVCLHIDSHVQQARELAKSVPKRNRVLLLQVSDE
jgi:phytoene/squalene synthetase